MSDDTSSGLPDDRWAPNLRERWQFYVDVVGTCNLRCPSCPVGNSDAKVPTGTMAPELGKPPTPNGPTPMG